MKQWKYVTASIVAALALVGCGGGDSESSTTPVGGGAVDTSLVGTFVDAPVAGLAYETPTHSGVTDAQGQFKFELGETVIFKLGNVKIGTVKGSPVVTPKNFGSTTAAVNLAYILQNLDTDGDPTNGAIELPPLETLQQLFNDLNTTALNLEDNSSIQTTLTTLKTQIEQDLNITLPDINITQALANMEQDIQEALQSSYVKATTSLIEGKTFTVLLVNRLDMPTEEHTVSLNSGILDVDSGTETASYTITDTGLIKVTWSDSSIEFWKIIENVDGVLMISSANETETDALDNMSVDLYVSTDASKITTLHDHLVEIGGGQKIDPTTLEDKMLYQFGYWNSGVTIQGIKILSSTNQITLYGSDLVDSINDSTMWPIDGNYTYNVSYPNGKLKISGHDNGGDEEGFEGDVYKFDLAGKTYPIVDMLDQYYGNIDAFKSAAVAEFGIEITFTKGAMYCPVLWNICWFDENAMNDILSQRAQP